jgi:hypothetical protein
LLQRIQDIGENRRHVCVGAHGQTAHVLTKLCVAMIEGVQFGLHGKAVKALNEV